MDNFYSTDDSTKIRNFVLLPKKLFTADSPYRNIPIRAKLAYAFYLRRFRATEYRDRDGPYIIYSDYDIAKSIDTNERYAGKIRRKLIDVGLISAEKTTRGNKIRVYSCTGSGENGGIFFTEHDLESWRFYRFPVKLLDQKYSLLDINVRVYYAMLFDMMCLSQANYFTDSRKRVYFQVSLDEQAARFDISKNSLTKYKNILQACGLLNEYRPFSQKTRYYLMKLDAYEDNADMFYNMTAHDKKAFIRSIGEKFKREYIDPYEGTEKKTEKQMSDAVKEGIKSMGISYSEAVERYQRDTGNSLSLSSLKKYLNGSRKMPECVSEYFAARTQQLPRKGTCNIESVQQFPKKGTSDFPEREDGESHIGYELYHRNDTPIRYTDESNTEYSYNNEDKLNKGKEMTEDPFSLFIEKINQFSILTEEDKLLLSDTVDRIRVSAEIRITDAGDEVVLGREQISDLFDTACRSDLDIEPYLIKILNALSRSTALSDISRTLSYMKVSLTDLLYMIQHHQWFLKKSRPSQLEIDIYEKKGSSSYFSKSVMEFNPFAQKKEGA